MDVYVGATLKGFFGRNDTVKTDADTVKGALDDLTKEYPDTTKVLFDDAGKLRGFINIFLNS
ncbi:MAG: hypothetical protein IJ245_09115 [Lachnospiraceae bacterium]|nr:hypothetical protein [Lachnospiraceae bacterium]